MSVHTVKIEFELPKELFFKGKTITQALIEAEALKRLAATFYADGSLSLGKAAKLAKVTKQDFLDFLGEHNIPLTYNIDEVEDDLTMVKEFLQSEIKVMGTAGILGLAAIKGLISNIDDTFNKLEQNGFRFTEDVRKKVKEGIDKHKS